MFVNKIKSMLVGTTALVMAASASHAADEVEVLHWWTSGGEAAALNVLKGNLEKEGISWADMPVAGGGGTEAMTVLRARATSGNPPTAAQLLGFDIQDWAGEGLLGNLNDVAAKEGWDDVIPAALQRFAKKDGVWVGAPVNIHSTNWVWANKSVLEKAGVKQPETWEEFVASLDKIKAAGIQPFAQGGQAWQEGTLFDSLVIGAGGLDFYKKAFIDLDMDAVSSDTMKEAFKRLTTLRGYFDENFSGRDWNLATAMVINGEAAYQIMGDWAKGEFIAAGKVPNEDFLCFRVPGTQGIVTFNSDMFGMFKVDASGQKAQEALARNIMDPVFQSAFNVVKGSVPARIDVPDTDFDACGKKAMKQLADANAGGTLVGAMGQGHAQPAALKNAYYDVVTAFVNGEYADEDEAVEELRNALEAAL